MDPPNKIYCPEYIHGTCATQAFSEWLWMLAKRWEYRPSMSKEGIIIKPDCCDVKVTRMTYIHCFDIWARQPVVSLPEELQETADELKVVNNFYDFILHWCNRSKLQKVMDLIIYCHRCLNGASFPCRCTSSMSWKDFQCLNANSFEFLDPLTTIAEHGLWDMTISSKCLLLYKFVLDLYWICQSEIRTHINLGTKFYQNDLKRKLFSEIPQRFRRIGKKLKMRLSSIKRPIGNPEWFTSLAEHWSVKFLEESERIRMATVTQELPRKYDISRLLYGKYYRGVGLYDACYCHTRCRLIGILRDRGWETKGDIISEQVRDAQLRNTLNMIQKIPWSYMGGDVFDRSVYSLQFRCVETIWKHEIDFSSLPPLLIDRYNLSRFDIIKVRKQ
jgi:hypothetical protein